MSHVYNLPPDDNSSDWFGCVVYNHMCFLVMKNPAKQDAAMLWAKYFHKRIPGSQPNVIHKTKINKLTFDYDDFLELLNNPPEPPSSVVNAYYTYGEGYDYVERDIWGELERILEE
jgi:hypothetical protein